MIDDIFNFLQFTPFIDHRFWLLIWSVLVMINLAGMYDAQKKDMGTTAKKMDMFLNGVMIILISPLCMVFPPLFSINIVFPSAIFLYSYLTRHKI